MIAVHVRAQYNVVKETAHTTMVYTVVFRTEPEGGYTVLVPALPEIVTYGKTLEEARAMATEAIALSVEGRMEDGEEFAEVGPLVIPREEYTGDLHIDRVDVELPEVVTAIA